MESFLVYLFNFYYAISELEQNKQNNTIIFFLLFIFLTKKWTSAVCGGVRAHPSHPPPYGPVPGLMVAIDFEKAFDSLSWNFLSNALRSFNFGDSFINWISVFYTNISSCVTNNGFSSPIFKVERGVRQGDPLSPYLFIIALELLLIKIRNDPCIKGIKIDNAEVKLAAFADDLTTFLRDKGSLEHLFSTLKAFEGCSGLKLNKDKTEAYWLGSSHNCNENLNIVTVNKPMKILGIYFTYNSRLKNELNFDAILKSLKKTLCNAKFTATVERLSLAKLVAMRKA